MRILIRNCVLILFVSSCAPGNETLNESPTNNNTYLKRKELKAFLKSAPVYQIQTTAKPFDNLTYNKVIAYDFDGQQEKRPTVFNYKRNKFIKKIRFQKSVDTAQLSDLMAIVSDSTTYGESVMACFEPKMGVVFYQGNKPVMEIDVCLDCNFLESSLPIPATEKTMIEWEDGEGYPARGFSSQGKQKIIDWCKALGLAYGEYIIPEEGEAMEEDSIL